MCPSNAQGTLPYLLVGRSDVPQVAVLDTMLPVNQSFILYQTHMLNNGQNTVRPQGLIVQGKGTITQGAAILICDSIRYQPMRALMFPNDPLQQTLLNIKFQGDLSCRQWSVVMALSGYNIEIRTQEPVYGQVNT